MLTTTRTLLVAALCALHVVSAADAQNVSLLGEASGMLAIRRTGESGPLRALLDMIVELPPDLPDNPFRRGRAPRVIPAPRTLTAAEKDLIARLEAGGMLSRVASDGRTVLAHLTELAACRSASRLNTMSGSVLALDLLKMLAPEDLAAVGPGQPLPGGVGEITQCETHYTCGAASIQVWMRLNRPEELVRIAHQLFCDGAAPLDGSTLKPARFSQVYHAGDRIFSNERFVGDEGTEDRCDLDILLQSALMDEIALGNWSKYDVYADCGGAGNVIAGNSGAGPRYIARQLERLTGGSFSGVQVLSGNPAKRLAMVEGTIAQLRAGKHAIILFNTDPDRKKALHYVTAVRWDEAAQAMLYVDTCEAKATRAKMYAMPRARMERDLRALIHQD